MSEEDAAVVAAGALHRKGTSAEERTRAASALAKIKHQKTKPRTLRRKMSHAAKCYWDSLTPEQRKIEMRRRRKIGYIRKKKAALEKLK